MDDVCASETTATTPRRAAEVPATIRWLQVHATYGEADTDQVGAHLASVVATADEPSARAILRHAYWRMPAVPTAALLLAAGGADRLRALVGRGPVIGSCRRCGGVVRARDRDDVDGDPPTLCPECAVRVTHAVAAPHAVVGSRPVDPPRPWRRPSVVGGRRRWAEEYPLPR